MTMGALLLLSSCGTYTATGTYTGATFGQVIGSAIGGIAGGWKGEHIGSLIGTMGGAAVGAAIGQAADNAQQKKYEDYAKNRASRQARAQQRNYDNSGFDPSNSHDDRITLDGDMQTGIDTRSSHAPMLEIRNARITDSDGDGILKRGETCRVTFEIMNHADQPAFNIQPLVTDVTGNKHVNVSPNLLIESINPHQGVRYTATILADNRLKDGEIIIHVGVAESQKELTAIAREFKVPTRKK